MTKVWPVSKQTKNMTNMNKNTSNTTQDSRSHSKDKTSQKSEVPTTYVWKGKTYEMGKVALGQDPTEQYAFMEKQKGYLEWRRAEANKLNNQILNAINENLASEKG